MLAFTSWCSSWPMCSLAMVLRSSVESRPRSTNTYSSSVLFSSCTHCRASCWDTEDVWHLQPRWTEKQTWRLPLSRIYGCTPQWWQWTSCSLHPHSRRACWEPVVAGELRLIPVSLFTQGDKRNPSVWVNLKQIWLQSKKDKSLRNLSEDKTFNFKPKHHKHSVERSATHRSSPGSWLGPCHPSC